MNISQLITDYGVDTLTIALGTVVFTGLLKIPIKKLAQKTKNSAKITRFITFLPIILGFALTVLCRYLLLGQVNFNKNFYAQWLSSVSLSLALYAFWEKFAPSGKKILSEAEIKANRAAVEELKTKFAESDVITQDDSNSFKETDCLKAVDNKKIILTNNKNLR